MPAHNSAPAYISTVADRFISSYVVARFYSGRQPRFAARRGLYLHTGSHAGLATPRSRQPHAGSLQPVCSSTPVRSSMLAHKGI